MSPGIAFVHYRRLRRDRGDGRVLIGERGWPAPEARGGATVRVARMIAEPFGEGHEKIRRSLTGELPPYVYGVTVAVCSIDDVYAKAVGRAAATAYATWPGRATLFGHPPFAHQLDALVAAAVARTSLARHGRLYRWLGRSAGIRRARKLYPERQLHLFSQVEEPAFASPFEASRAWALVAAAYEVGR